jgi:hypothetical protein
MNTREEWLNSALIYVREHLALNGASLSVLTRVSCGFPTRAKSIGQCWSDKASADGTYEIFISPTQDDALRVLDILIHEAIHAAVGTEHGHKAPFAKVAKACGLTGKMTATTASDELRATLSTWLEHLGAYPHARLDPSQNGIKKQSTRLLKCECPNCKYTVRVTAKWIDFSGAPICPTEACEYARMNVDGQEEGDD